jgi:two-component system LytT family response regulator
VKILLVDDESLALSRLERFIGALNYEYRSFNDALEALEACKNECFDIAILDIDMPKLKGTDLARQIKYLHPECFIVFQTAYEQYALEAFDVGAIGYLTKPFSQEDIEQNIQRAKSYRQSQSKKFMSKNGNEYYLVDENDIYYVKADLTEVIIRTAEGFSYYNKKISQMQELLSDKFFKIHRSYIVNLDKIASMQTLDQSKIEFSFQGIDDRVESSKEGAKKFRTRYKQTF